MLRKLENWVLRKILGHKRVEVTGEWRKLHDEELCDLYLSPNMSRVIKSRIVTYGCEAWTLTNRDEQYLRIFERRILRKICGPVQNEDGFWKIKMNYELNDLIKNADVVRFVKTKRMAWLRHVMRMEGKRIPKRVLEWKPTGRRNRGRPRKRWVGDIEEDLQIMGVRGWKKLCKERAE